MSLGDDDQVLDYGKFFPKTQVDARGLANTAVMCLMTEAEKKLSFGNVVKAAAESSGTRGRLTVGDAAAVLRSEAFAYAGYSHLVGSQISFTPSFQMMMGGSEACFAVEDRPAGRDEKEDGETKEEEEEETEKEVNEKAVENDEEGGKVGGG